MTQYENRKETDRMFLISLRILDCGSKKNPPSKKSKIYYEINRMYLRRIKKTFRK